jgi:transcription elongation factor SPT5
VPSAMPKRRTVDEESELGSTVGDDEDDDAEEAEAPARKKGRVRNAFIQDEVDVEDEEDEDDDDEEGLDADEYEQDDGAENVDQRSAERMNRSLDAQRRKEEDAKLREQVKQRYEGEGASRVAYAEDAEDEGGRFKELPDAVTDPKLWLIKCKPNAEKMLVISLMQKYLDSMHTEKPLQIKSAMCTDVKGYIYLEAFKEIHVREATQGLNNLFYRIAQVPNNEMTDVMRVRVAEKRKPLQRNMWVRMKRNDDYKDDLAQVIDVDLDGVRATVRLIPRLRIHLTRGNEDEEADTSRMRPPAKLFKPEEIESYGGEVNYTVQAGKKRFNYDGLSFEDGLLIKGLAVRNLRWGDDIVPSIAELERFKAGLGAGAEAELLAAINPAQLHKETFKPGDVVKVSAAARK